MQECFRKDVRREQRPTEQAFVNKFTERLIYFLLGVRPTERARKDVTANGRTPSPAG